MSGLSLVEQMKKVTHPRAFSARTARKDGDEEAFLNALDAIVSPDDERFFPLLGDVSDRVYKLLAHYNDNGHGDKPPDLHRVTYWFQHLDVESIFAARDAIKPKPPTNSIVRADRPKSTAFKCRKCKQKLERGQLALKTCHVRMNPHKAEWREEGTKYTHASCMTAHDKSMARACPLGEGVTEFDRVAALV